MADNEVDHKFAIAVRLGLLDSGQQDAIAVERSKTGETRSEIAVRKGFLARNELDLINAFVEPLNVVPGYRIQGLIGQGGVGTVFKRSS